MATAAEAILSIRHVVQDHGGEYSVLGGPAQLDGVIWFGQLLRWQWPPSYLQVLEKHDGFYVQDAIVFGFLQSFETFLLYHDRWHRPDGYWPLGEDGCGDYYAFALGRRDAQHECPIVFFDTEESSIEPVQTVAPTYADFIVQQMAEQCDDVGCSVARVP